MRKPDAYYATRFAPDAKREHVWKVLAGWIGRRYVPAAGAVLDLGCGYCGFVNNVKVALRVGIDASAESQKHAADGVKILTADAVRGMAGLKASSFDTVFASNFLEHLERRESDAVLKGVLRVLKPAGRLVLLQPNFRYCYREYFDDYTHRSIFTDTGLSDYLAASGFRVEECRPRFLPFSMKSGAGAFYRLIGLYLVLPFKIRAGQMLLVARKPD